MELTPLQEVYFKNEVINCTAHGNPEPFIYWIDLVTDEEILESSLRITADMADDPQSFRCVAVNEVSGETRNDTIDIDFTAVGKCQITMEVASSGRSFQLAEILQLST